MKFQRDFSMTVQVSETDAAPGIGDEPVFNNEEVGFANRPGTTRAQGNAVIINYPLTLELEIVRNTLASANRAHFTIYNLKEETRRKILHDRFDMNDVKKYRKVILNAGYSSEPRLPVIFQGNIMYAYSQRRKENWITEIEAFDGGFARSNGNANLTVPSGYNTKNLVRALISSLPKTSLGAIGDVGQQQSSRGYTVAGNTWEALQAVAPDADVFVDNEVVNVIGKDEYIRYPDEPFVISSATGLLDTPRRYNVVIEVPILFEPRARVGMLIELQGIDPYWNGLHKVIGVAHRGVISGAVNGQLVTTLTVSSGAAGLTGVEARG